MKVIIQFSQIPDGQIDLLNTARSWLSEYGLNIKTNMTEDGLLWMIDPTANENLNFLFLVDETEDDVITKDFYNKNKEIPSQHLEEMMKILERVSKMSEPLNEEETANFLSSIAKNLEYLNKDNERILQEIDKLNNLNDSSDSFIMSDNIEFDDSDDLTLDEEIYRQEIIDRIMSVNKDEVSLNIIEILLEYIDDEKIDKTVYNKLKSID